MAVEIHTRLDATALGELYDLHSAAAYGLALRITGDAGLAEDAVRDAFLSIWRDARTHEAGPRAARASILTIVHHRSLDNLRKR